MSSVVGCLCCCPCSSPRRRLRRQHQSSFFSSPRRKTTPENNARKRRSASRRILRMMALSKDFDASHADENGYPRLIVFDLDACFWNQEMYQLRDVCEPKNNVIDEKTGMCVGAVSGRTVIKMHEGSRKALTEYYEGKYPGARLATASSADTPLAVKIGQSALRNLEIAPGVSAASVFAIGWEKEFDGNMQIGRTPPLSANKAQTHFPILRKFTNIEYHKMLFFDDCNWGDHCGAVESQCVEPKAGLGPAIQRTPRGLGVKEWETALMKYKARHEQYFK
mmetsp:Transcript_3206/g.9870  ORF Transcript_3206/g.9870 Transcript_3206/m.9870 type:complete len:279 (+) Transcript_3206:1442-2278(+)